ncbi:TonB-dependent receptor [Iodobacter sp. CM08]|uniref:TonB-dependent receptor domain-containing protein n=1 Tax=Iodobacter sp. CM08 TaxID=3085902 RepID=UPI0029815ABD|nr:TonB-dependent receptor [Iodobacter sp. CM08]MDW5418219.1 TonB-dependent receptor [Iodobacter sp. CM08]
MPPLPLRSLVVLLPLAFNVYAEDIVQLPAVQAIAQTPSQDGTVERAQLKESQARDLHDMFKQDAEISVSGGSNPVAQKVYIRGMEESMLNVSIDGATQNNHLYHHQSTLVIDPALIKRVEIEKGTAAASAGPGALGGAIRVLTLDASDLLSEGQNTGALLSGGLMSNKGWKTGATVYGRFGSVDGLISASHLDLSDYQSGGGIDEINSGSKQRNLLIKLGANISESQRLSLSHQATEDKGTRYLRANMVGFKHPVLPNEAMPQSLLRNTTSLKYDGKDFGPISRIEATLYQSKVEGDRTNKAGEYSSESITTQGLDIGLKSAIGEHLLKYGVNLRKENSQTNQIRDPYQNTGSGKEESTVAGGYVEGLLDFGKVNVSAGLRYDRYDYTDNHNQNFKSNGFSPSAGVSWQVIDSLQLKAGYAKALRGVGLNEVFLLDMIAWANAPKIEAEKASNSEVGFVFTNKGFTLSGNLFQQNIDNFIDVDTCTANPDADCRMNVADVDIKGYELRSEYREGNLRIGLSIAESKSDRDGKPFSDGDQGLGTSYGRSWTTHAAYDIPTYSLQLGWQGRFVEALDYTPVASTTPMTKAGFGVNDLYVNWQPLKKDTLNLRFAVKNVFDQQYYDQATFAYHARLKKVLGHPEAGRDIRIEASYKF